MVGIDKKIISIIIPVFNEAKNAPLLYHEVMEHVRDLPHTFKFIFVDDGSHDFSSEAVEELARNVDHVQLIQFSRNFGKEAAVSAGLHAAYENGSDAAMAIDADFQHPPQLIADFIDKWQDGVDVVVGVKRYGPTEGWFKRFSSDLFYKLIKPISHIDLVPHATDFRLLDRKVLQAFMDLPERNRMTRGLVDWLGFNRDFVYFEAAERLHGQRGYSYRKLVQLAIDSLTSYTMLPLRIAGYLGLGIIVTIGPLGIFTYIEMFVMHDPLGWNVSNIVMLALMLLFLIGLVLASLGLVALYIAQIHTEVTGRPLYIVRKRVTSGDAALHKSRPRKDAAKEVIAQTAELTHNRKARLSAKRTQLKRLKTATESVE